METVESEAVPETDSEYISESNSGPTSETDSETVSETASETIPEAHAVTPIPVQAEDVADETYYRVQVGLFRVRQNADNLLYELLDQGYPAFILYDDGYYKVQVGAYRVLGLSLIHICSLFAETDAVANIIVYLSMSCQLI